MIWSGLNRQVDPALFSSMSPEKILYDFDGPQIFTFMGSFGQELLAYLCSALAGCERFIVVPTTPTVIGELERGELAVRDALTNSWIWIVDRSYSGDVLAAWAVEEASLPRTVLPEAGILLIPPDMDIDDTFASPVASLAESFFVEFHLKPEKNSSLFTNDIIFPSMRACTAFLRSAFMRFLNVEPEFVFSSAGTGSFVLRDEVRIAHDKAERLPEVVRFLTTEARTGPDNDGLESWRRLLNVLRENRVEVTIKAFRNTLPLEFIELGTSQQKEIRHRIQETRKAASPDQRIIVVDSLDVPQADDLIRVFQVAELRVAGCLVTPESLGGITPRQVSYYTRAAKLLNLLDEEDELTPGGQIFGRLPDEDQLRTCVVHFESSICGEAWIRWSVGNTLLDVRPESSADFLKDCSSGLSEDTQLRRAKTLSNWYGLLIPHHYARQRF